MVTDKLTINSSSWTQVPSGTVQFMLQKGSALCALSTSQPTKDLGYPVIANQIVAVENPVWLKSLSSDSIDVVYSK